MYRSLLPIIVTLLALRECPAGNEEDALPDEDLYSTSFYNNDSDIDHLAIILGLRILHTESGYGALRFPEPVTTTFTIVGYNLKKLTGVYLTPEGFCFPDDKQKVSVSLDPVFGPTGDSYRLAHVKGELRQGLIYHLCANDSDIPSYQPFVKVMLDVPESSLLMPFSIEMVLIVLLVMSSSLFSGLNVGLMSLSVTDLELIINNDTAQAMYARNILPLRKNGNFLLCSILIGNTCVNTTMTLLIGNVFDATLSDDLSSVFSFFLKVCVPTIFIVICGEIVPQAICCRYGMFVGSQTRYITIVLMVLTSPLSYPLSIVLDCFIGVERPVIYDRPTLARMVEMNIEPDEEGVSKLTSDMLRRTLKIELPRAVDVMTAIEKVFMLPESTIVDTDLLFAIHEKGHTRIPVYRDGDRNHITSIINVKDLVPIDPKCKLKIKTVADVWHRQNQCRFVLETCPINQLLKEMKRGHPIAVVVRYEPTYKDYRTTGVIALEDIIEEITGEILDEKDVKKQHQVPCDTKY